MFALFASIGFISLAFNSSYLSPFRIFFAVLISGGFAIGYAAVSLARRFWLIPIIGIIEGLVFSVDGYLHSNSPPLISPDSEFQKQLAILAIGSIVSVVVGYALFVVFFAKQGARLFRAQTEITLAGEIHHALVPPIQQTMSAFELYGASVPSGVVGGDLVDVVANSGNWTAYIADVSGHGVAAGVLMAMFKTAVRTHAGKAPEILLRDVNRTLYPLKTDNTFVTAGVLRYSGDGRLSLALAGHPPLLRYNRSTKEVEEYRPADMPVGILPEESFTAVPVACEPGDVLLLVTDGLTEVFDSSGQEMGLDPLKRALAQGAALPLAELFARLREVALNTGPQLDDQTALVIRRMS